MKKGIVLALAASVLLTCGTAFAAQQTVWEMADSDKYGTKVGGMLGRGLVNAATCFVDVIVQTVNGTKDGQPFIGTLTGLGSGIGCTALRATSGALDVATFWVPGFNGIPVSKSYANCLDFEESAPPAATQAYEAPAAPVIAPAAVAPKHNAMNYVKK